MTKNPVPLEATCVLCHERLIWSVSEGTWVTATGGYDVCPTDRKSHDPRDAQNGPLPLYDEEI